MKNKKTVKKNDETPAVADAFNEITAAQEKRTALLEQAVRDRDAVIAAVAHEIKTPLTMILGYSSLLQGFRMDTAESKQFLQNIHSETKRMERLTQKLKALYRISDDGPLKPEVVSVTILLQQLKDITGYMLLKRNQTLVCDANATRASLDPELFLVVLKNLVENASAASKDKARLGVTVYKKEQNIVFFVEDTGCGMEEERLKRLFEPSEDAKDGRGTGLSLCKRIVEAHGGSISVESEPAKGTKVYVLLPDSF